MPRLDTRTIASLAGPEPGRFDVVHWDDDLPGFGLRLLARGGRSWVVRYRIGKRQRVVTMAKAGALRPADARRKAGEILAKAKLGTDARVEITAAREQAAESFERVAKEFIVAKERDPRRPRRPSYLRELRRYLIDADAKALHTLPVRSIERGHVARVLDAIGKRGSPTAADRCRTALSSLFSWAMRKGLVDANPVIGTERRIAPTDERRDRRLSDDELRLVWKATGGQGDHNAIVRLLILTGQRREEVAGMRWAELDLDNALWTLPRGRTKNREQHEVPLSGPALRILGALPRRGERELVFGEREGSFSGWSQSKRRLDGRVTQLRAEVSDRALDEGKKREVAADAPVGWRLHDIRRTVVTGMGELGMLPHVVEAVVNHLSGLKAGVAGTYNRATYPAEKRRALDLWGAHVTALVADEPAEVAPPRREPAVA